MTGHLSTYLLARRSSALLLVSLSDGGQSLVFPELLICCGIPRKLPSCRLAATGLTFVDVWGRPLDKGTLEMRGRVAAMDATGAEISASVGLGPSSAQARERVKSVSRRSVTGPVRKSVVLYLVYLGRKSRPCVLEGSASD